MTELRLSYYPDITQYCPADDVRDAVEEFAAALQKELRDATGRDYTVPVLPVASVPDQTRMASDAQCEIALMKPSSYIYARRHNPAVDVGAIALRTIDENLGDTYFAQIYAHHRIGVSNFDELRRKCAQPLQQRPIIGFGDSFSTSNFLVNAALLKDNNIHPLTRFRRIEFFGGHDLVARAVYEGQADVGAGHNGAITDLSRQDGFNDAQQVMHCIGRRDIASDPIALIVSDDSLRGQIENALLAVQKLPNVKNALKTFWGADGLGPATHEKYKSIEASMRSLEESLGLSEADVLGI
ncbi:phosphate/phosphite/phosphonate ABC transporter substrate-binding protein [Nocardia vaccinii]|uniref:phosphate/phosphite/phosphonate ABC transporter substrate-binding protein n=1 Tax=Nocardia vaccinii TaxID=1822 RepID=UPI00082B3ECB|nr:PhnD/SsuA/transferrin family substrate-binding protein [Nocardia vaccinii]